MIILAEDFCFRPHAGDYFFIMCVIAVFKRGFELNKFPSPCWGLFFYLVNLAPIQVFFLVLVSVPVLGIIFLSKDELQTIENAPVSFRPRAGDYFFIEKPNSMH